MKTYEEIFQEAEDQGNARELFIDIVKWETEGQTIAGEVISFDAFDSGYYDQECLSWHIQTDTGLVSCVVGAVADAYMQDILVGDYVKLVYKGKKILDNGRRVNQFSIKHIPVNRK
jgi:hypothetical protein